MSSSNSPPVVAFGAAVGLAQLSGLDFDPAKNYTGCKLCGAVFQTDYDRNPHKYVNKALFLTIEMVDAYALGLRKEWSQEHAKTHSEREHKQLEASGRWCTPEAAYRLAAYGVIPIVDMVMDNEIEHALLESKPVPTDDTEG